MGQGDCLAISPACDEKIDQILLKRGSLGNPVAARNPKERVQLQNANDHSPGDREHITSPHRENQYKCYISIQKLCR